MGGVKLRLAVPGDAAAISRIYAPYVTGTAISFETEAPDEGEIAARMAAGAGLYPWLVACDEDAAILGYTYAAAFRARRAYRFAVETTVYIANDAHGQGVGSALYRALLATVEAQGFTQAIGAITLPNEASLRLHAAHGFHQAGVYEEVGYKLGAWLSVALWQRSLAPASAAPAEPRPVSDVWREHQR